MKNLKTPPFGKELAFQLATGKEPLFIPICVGDSCWDRAKYWHRCDGMPPLVLPSEGEPSDYYWSVEGYLVVVDVSEGSDDITLCELVALLLREGATTVTVWRPWAVNSIVKYSAEVNYV